MIEDYTATVRRIPPGAELDLRPGGRSPAVRIKGFLGNGGTTVIYEIEGGRAIRLARADGLTKDGPTYQAYLDWFAAGVARVAETDTPVVKVYSDVSWPDHYLIVEKLEPPSDLEKLYSLDDFFSGRIKNIVLKERMTAALVEDFAPKTWQLRSVADLRADQILFTRRGWVIADLSETVRMAKTVGDATIFSGMAGAPLKWRVKLEKIVTQSRRTQELKANFAQHVLAHTRRCVAWLVGVTNF